MLLYVEIVALRTHETSGDRCPANWDKRSFPDTIKPTPESVAEYLTKHFLPSLEEPEQETENKEL